jgi:hypothetical protein
MGFHALNHLIVEDFAGGQVYFFRKVAIGVIQGILALPTPASAGNKD